MRSLVLSVLLCMAGLVHAQRPSPVSWRHLLPPARSAAVVAADVPRVVLPSAFSYERLGLFCKAEYHLHRWLPIPVLIRIGDVERDEEVDGKGAYRQAW